MLAKEKGVSGAPGMGVQANISWNKMHQQFEADGKINAPPPINKKTSRWSGLILNITLIFNGRWCKTGPAWVKNGAVKTTLTFQPEGKRWQIAFPPGRPLLMAPFATPPPIKPRSVLSLRAAGTPADGVRLSEPAGA